MDFQTQKFGTRHTQTNKSDSRREEVFESDAEKPNSNHREPSKMRFASIKRMMAPNTRSRNQNEAASEPKVQLRQTSKPKYIGKLPDTPGYAVGTLLSQHLTANKIETEAKFARNGHIAYPQRSKHREIMIRS
ncbi:hypothetical protein L596_020589 [Steinernema carpocapsae]|uniref:Uncharacterized protein n=1 Tax=Steinernema carpocapsae TaxID=34508 RepID=A0A4V6A0Z1_STECR|nr:hypothetical protein L596_020589 [Steinernema carpocapsae]